MWRSRAFWVAIILFVLAGLVVAGFLIVPRIPAFREWRADSLATEALADMANQDWEAAQQKVASAFQLAPQRLLPVRAAARLNAAASHPQTLMFFQRLARHPDATPEDKLGFAEAALQFGDYRQFEKLVDALAPSMANDPRFLSLTARYALVTGENEAALELFRQAAGSGSLDARTDLYLATLSVGSAEEATLAAEELLRLAEENPEMESRILATLVNVPGTPATARSEALRRLRGRTGMAMSERVRLAAETFRSDPAAGEEELQKLKESALLEDEKREVARLLVQLGRYDEAQQLLPLSIARASRESFLVWLDATSGLGAWQEVLNALSSNDVPLDRTLVRLYTARALEETGDAAGAEASYNAAVRTPTEDLAILFYLAGYLNQIGRLDLAETVLGRLRADPVTARSAYESLVSIYRTRRDTAKLAETLNGMKERWPKDVAVRNDAAYLSLLQGKSLASSLREAEQLVAENPDLFPPKITRALALYRLGDSAGALRIFQDSQIQLRQLLPFQRAVFAALLRAEGMDAAAEGVAASVARPDQLLPEERELLSPQR